MLFGMAGQWMCELTMVKASPLFSVMKSGVNVPHSRQMMLLFII